MKQYYRVMLGAKSAYARECFDNNFIGADFGIHEDLTDNLPENWRDFNAKYRAVWLQSNPDKSKIAAGLACGMLWTICKGLNVNDVILCPDGSGNYYAGEIKSGYSYHTGKILPHRRYVTWASKIIERASMSQELRNSTGSVGTVSNITQHADEIEKLIEGDKSVVLVANDSTVVDPIVFALEKHLEDFLIKNWRYTELGTEYNIYEEDGELVGQQYPSDTGPIDILAISKDRKTILVVELKKGRVSDSVVGQIQRYMGYIKDEIAEHGQLVKGVIIGLEDDIRLRRALSVTNNIEFYRYKVSFSLFKC